MIRKIILFALIALMACLLSGCLDLDMDAVVEEMMAEQKEPEPLLPLSEPFFEDEAALYYYYNQVKLTDTVTSLKSRFGDPERMETEGGVIYTWVMEDGYGFSVGTFDNGQVRGKVLYLKDLRQLGRISASPNPANASSLTKDFSFSQVKSILGGKPMQIMLTAKEQGPNPDLSAMYIWANETGELAQVLFNSSNRVESFSYMEAVQPE